MSIIPKAAFLVCFVAALSHGAVPKRITYIQHDGIFSIEPTMDLWPSKENYPFGDYFVFVRFTPPPQSHDRPQFQVMLQTKALPKSPARTVESVVREIESRFRTNKVAMGPINITKSRISGYAARRMQYTSRGPGGKPVIIVYNFLVVERRIFAILCAAFPDELPKYQPIFDKMLHSLKINPQALVATFPIQE